MVLFDEGNKHADMAAQFEHPLGLGRIVSVGGADIARKFRRVHAHCSCGSLRVETMGELILVHAVRCIMFLPF